MDSQKHQIPLHSISNWVNDQFRPWIRQCHIKVVWSIYTEFQIHEISFPHQ